MTINTVLSAMRLASFAFGLAVHAPAVLAQVDGGPQAGSQESDAKPNADHKSLSGDVRGAGAPTASAPQASSSDIDGETMFATSCGWCHAQGGRAAGRGPKLAGTKRSDAFIVDRIKHGKLGAMPAFGHAFSDAQIIAILAYIRGLDVSEK
jgi:mono/diheme cytochrome c family protein